jgi:hypothetical protein
MNHPGPDINPRELSDELAKEMNGIKRTSTNGHNGNNSQGNGANGNGLLTPSVVGVSVNLGLTLLGSQNKSNKHVTLCKTHHFVNFYSMRQMLARKTSSNSWATSSFRLF